MKLWIKAVIVMTILYAAMYLIFRTYEESLGINLFALFIYLLLVVAGWAKLGSD